MKFFWKGHIFFTKEKRNFQNFGELDKHRQEKILIMTLHQTGNTGSRYLLDFSETGRITKGVVFMRYNIIGKNIDVWDKTKEMVERKMDRIEKLFPAETEATITLSLEKLVSTVEVTIPLNKRYIRAEVQDADMTAAMDKAVDILEGQVVRYKKRMRTKVRGGSDAYAAEYAAIMVPEESLDDEPMVKIERVKRFEVKPMDAEEAVMEMELVGHNFFVFRNGETDEVNVVYKRKNGSYGLIEPEY